MAKTMTKLNKTKHEQLIAEKNKVISLTIQASNNKVKDKIKGVVPKNKKAGPIKDRLNVIQHANSGKKIKKKVTQTQGKTVIKEIEGSKRKTKGVPRKEIKNKTKGEVSQKDEEEMAYKG